jgi:hypothetical protein
MNLLEGEFKKMGEARGGVDIQGGTGGQFSEKVELYTARRCTTLS